MDMPSDTIAAIATPLGEGGISIVRISGPQALDIADRVFRPVRPGPLQAASSHTVHYGTIVDGAGNTIDEAMVSIFRRPRSYTKEDSVEMSTHGGVVVTKRVLETVLACGARPADPENLPSARL